MNTKAKKGKKTEDARFLGDSRRAAYMIAWRDRRIATLEETVAGYREECDLMEALLAFALCRAARPRKDGTRALHIPKAKLTAMLGAWESSLTADESAYHLTFRIKEAGSDGAQTTQDQGE